MKAKYLLVGETYGWEGVWWEEVIATGNKKEMQEKCDRISYDNHAGELRNLRVEKEENYYVY
jgi:hypothetical protein